MEARGLNVDDLRSKSCLTLRTLNYGNYGIFCFMGNAGFISSTVVEFEAA